MVGVLFDAGTDELEDCALSGAAVAGFCCENALSAPISTVATARTDRNLLTRMLKNSGLRHLRIISRLIKLFLVLQKVYAHVSLRVECNRTFE